MKIAIIGSRTLKVDNLENYLPEDVSEIVSGGAKGIDACAAECAKKLNLKLTEFIPDYARYGRAAPLKRNVEIARYSDCAIAFWNGVSKGTLYTVNLFRKAGKPVTVIEL